MSLTLTFELNQIENRKSKNKKKKRKTSSKDAVGICPLGKKGGDRSGHEKMAGRSKEKKYEKSGSKQEIKRCVEVNKNAE